DAGSVAVGSPRALASASNGRLAVGSDDSSQPAVYTFSATGSFQNQYLYGPGASAVDVAFSANASTLYAVTYQASSYSLHVLTDLDAGTPPVPTALSATPDYHAIDLQWGHVGLYQVDTV